jgi:hypothetical protein
MQRPGVYPLFQVKQNRSKGIMGRHHTTCGVWIIMRCTKQIEAAEAEGYPLSEVKQNGSKGSS